MGKTAVVNETTLVTCLVAELIALFGCFWAVYYDLKVDGDGILSVFAGFGGFVVVLLFMATVFTALGIK
jgi:hypothetical protein